MKYRGIFPLLLFFIQPASAEVISKIIITGNRVNESVIRSRLAFKEGDTLNEAAIEKSKTTLYSLGLFKSLNITKASDSAAGETTVIVDARDGWFILPWPMFGSRGGSRYAGGMVIEQNYFKSAERVFLFGNYSDNASLNMVSVMLPELTFGAILDKRSLTEYLYADGAYNSSVLSENDIEKIEQYGIVTDSHEKEVDYLRFNLGKPVTNDLNLALSVLTGTVKYSNAAQLLQKDTGRVNALQLQASFGKPESRMDMLTGFGRIFGLGMADLKDNLKPLTASKTNYGLIASIENSNKGFGSDFEYNKAAFSVNRSTIFRNRSQFSLLCKAGFGSGLPASQLFATDRREGLKGTYAREFRGDAITIANTSYKHSFSRNSTGQLNGEIYAEFAAAHLNDARKEKQGAGVNLTYQFWRFPLPLGFGYTYSFDDEDWQATVGIGGMF